MSFVGNHDAKPEEIIQDTIDAIYIWIDILGFSDEITRKDSDYLSIRKLLTQFQEKFISTEWKTLNISDGLLVVKKLVDFKDGQQAKNVENFFNKIGDCQFSSLESNDFRKMIRGGIALGSFLKLGAYETETIETYIVSNGLAKAYSLESKAIKWPIIGTSKEYLEEIKLALSIDDMGEKFGLMKSYNDKGEDIYFIDFLNNANPQFATKIEDSIGNCDSKDRSKYLWLCRFYRTKYGDVDFTNKFAEDLKVEVI